MEPKWANAGFDRVEQGLEYLSAKGVTISIGGGEWRFKFTGTIRLPWLVLIRVGDSPSKPMSMNSNSMTVEKGGQVDVSTGVVGEVGDDLSTVPSAAEDEKTSVSNRV